MGGRGRDSGPRHTHRKLFQHMDGWAQHTDVCSRSSVPPVLVALDQVCATTETELGETKREVREGRVYHPLWMEQNTVVARPNVPLWAVLESLVSPTPDAHLQSQQTMGVTYAC